MLAILFTLFLLFGNALDLVPVLPNGPFALIGGIAALLLTGVNFSLSAGVGFIALFGLSPKTG